MKYDEEIIGAINMLENNFGDMIQVLSGNMPWELWFEGCLFYMLKQERENVYAEACLTEGEERTRADIVIVEDEDGAIVELKCKTHNETWENIRSRYLEDVEALIEADYAENYERYAILIIADEVAEETMETLYADINETVEEYGWQCIVQQGEILTVFCCVPQEYDM